MNPFSIQTVDGIPALFKAGKPFNPISFWSSDVNPIDFPAFRRAGITLFTCFRSGPYFQHPYWIGENQYDFSYYDQYLNLFHELVPDGFIIPRIFVSAPYWWLDQHPEELVCYGYETPYTRDPRGTYHESFASELWKKEQGEALRQLLHHFKNSPYGHQIAGIHIAGGSCGEWHYWGNLAAPDCGAAMRKRLGRPVPPPNKRDPEFFRCFYTSTVDAIDHFCRIVKEETDYLTVVFYAYMNETANLYSAHCAAEEFMRLESVDIVSAPHTYQRRIGGQDAYFRAFPASLALHGKLFLDESDDRTPLASEHYYAGKRIYAETQEEAVNMIWRELGNAVTHGLGQWFMDIDGGMFRDSIYMETIAEVVKCGERILKLPKKRVSEVALIFDASGCCYYSRQQYPAPIRFVQDQLLEISRAGAPFDTYCAADLSMEQMNPYKVIIIADGIALSESSRQVLKELRKDGRTFIWNSGSGAVSREIYRSPAEGMSDLTGIEFKQIECQGLSRPGSSAPEQDENACLIPEFLPENADRDFGSWRSIYRAVPNFSATELRTIYRENGVHIYSETNDVFSCSANLFMLHASEAGIKKITLPSPGKVIDLRKNLLMSPCTSEFTFELKFGETALFELEPAQHGK